MSRIVLRGLATIGLGLLLSACLSPYEWRHEGQWNSLSQVWASGSSQLQLRSAQSRVFQTDDYDRILSAVLATIQDLNFMVVVLDDELGIVSAQQFVPLERSEFPPDPSYHWYDDQSLLLFTRLRAYRRWGPFHHRSDLVRLTVTIRPRGEGQTVVRASAQFYLMPVEDPEAYQKFFRSLEQAMFLEAKLVEEAV